MQMIGNIEGDNMDVFNCQALQDLIDYKWNSHCGMIHYFGAMSHLTMLVLYSIYIIRTYCYLMDGAYIITPMLILMIYPLIYDMSQLYTVGFTEYIQDPWNWFDQAYIFLGTANLFQHAYSDPY